MRFRLALLIAVLGTSCATVGRTPASRAFETRFREKLHFMYSIRDPRGDGPQRNRNRYLDSLEWVRKSILTRSGFERRGLTDAELVSIYLYSLSDFITINFGLRERIENEGLQAFREVLTQALAKLPPHEGWVYRQADLPREVLSEYQEGRIVRDRGFMSSRTTPFDQLPVPVKHKITILSKTGRFIDPYAARGYEREVLFAPDTPFEVVSRKDLEDGGYDIVLREVSS